MGQGIIRRQVYKGDEPVVKVWSAVRKKLKFKSIDQDSILPFSNLIGNLI
jgi:hypothetical protein